MAFVPGCGGDARALGIGYHARESCAVRRVEVVVRNGRARAPGPMNLVVGFDTTQEEAMNRLQMSLPEFDEETIEKALAEAGGNDEVALSKLVAKCSAVAEREQAIAKFKERGRISAVEEAMLRRRVIGSAKDFFKTQIEVQGSYVDAGYVSDDPDPVGEFMGKVGKFLGFGRANNAQKSQPDETPKAKPFVPRISEYVSDK
ncbi:hypothetical protein FVE85_4125 [Porphyridium purpureum]|uniref:CUE domain-containing protein n=1 Tax=Porphyridium purpureum TaxID=35688 RepID=A0A5J4YTA4_PORPP|nr:hypothetical protein FVE85_4125 [Porphyridium purpureum]|eukprot:POR4385..scf229_5